MHKVFLTYIVLLSKMVFIEHHLEMFVGESSWN